MKNILKLLQGVEVEWKTLGEIFIQFSGMSGVSNKWKEEGNCVFIDYMNVYTNTVVDISALKKATVKNLKQNCLEQGDVLFTSASETPDECAIASEIEDNIEYDVFMDDHLFGLRVKKEYRNNIARGFLKYVFRSPNFRSQVFKTVRGVTRFYISKNDFMKLSIPIPPLPVQNEIVRILDKFSTLTAELQAELQARKSQYKYYRNELLDYPMEESDQPSLRSGGSAASIKESDKQIQQQSAQNHPTDNSVLPPQGKVQWKTLGEIGRFYGGITGKSKDDFTDGNAKFITYKNVYTNPSLNLDIKEKVRIYDGEKQHTLQYADIIFTGSSETPDECGLTSIVTEKIDEKLYLNSFCFFLRLFDTEIIIPTFAKHLFRSKNLRQQISKTASGVTRFNVSKKLMEKVLIPIPPIKEQERIASILDKFDTLTNSISEGLPKMIEQSQKRYEYYRDMLLTFPSLRATPSPSLQAVPATSLRAAGEAIQKQTQNE